MTEPATIAKPGGGRAVMENRMSSLKSLDYFPTPPWATRALLDVVQQRGADLSHATCWDPCAGSGHMVGPLSERFADVWASDVFDYGVGYMVGSFIGEQFDDVMLPMYPDWIIMNPPFKTADRFVIRALHEAKYGVAALVRTSWLDTIDRHKEIFEPLPPTCISVFSERVAMHKGRWVPGGSTATFYCWVIWERWAHGRPTELCWIPPGSKKALTNEDDVELYADLGVIDDDTKSDAAATSDSGLGD